MASSWARKPASSAAAIFEAQEAFAPSQIIPETAARVFMSAAAHCSRLPPASQVLADVMLSHWPISAWQPQLPTGWTLTDNGDKRELRNASGKLVTEIIYLNRKGKREPISIEQHVFKYHITIQYLGD